MTDNNPFLVGAIGDFNARSSSWCINDKVIMGELKQIDIDLIRKAMNEFNWEMAFFNLNVNEKVSLFLIQLLRT